MSNLGSELLVGALFGTLTFTAGVAVACDIFDENPIKVYNKIGKNVNKTVTKAKNNIKEFINSTKENQTNDSFKFISILLDMDIEALMEIFPEIGTVENIFKMYTYEEALKRYNNWLFGPVEE